jgi:hypothetical protein
VTVVSDKGTGFGAFAPIPVHALLGDDVIDEETSSWTVLGLLGWMLRMTVFLIAIAVASRWLFVNQILIRIAVMKVIDLIRGKKKRGEYLLVDEMANIESGGYKMFGDGSRATSLSHRSPPPPLVRAEDHEMYRLVNSSSNRVYHRA